MPTVPRLTNTQVAETPYRPVERTGGGLRVPNAFQMAGQSLGAMAEVQADVERHRAQTALIDFDNTLSETEGQLLTDPDRGVLNRFGKDAIGSTARALSEFDRAASKNEMRLPPLARERSRQVSLQRRERLERQAQTHEARQFQVYQDSESKAGQELARAEAVRNWADPAMIASSLERQRTLIRIDAGRHGWGADQTQTAMEDATAATHAAVLQGAIQAKDVSRASAYLEAFADQLPLEVRGRAQKAVSGLRVDVATSSIMADFERSVSAGTKALGRLGKSGLSDDDMAAVRSQVGVRRNQLEAERGDQSARQIATLQDRIESGSASSSDLAAIDGLFERSALSRAGMLSLRGAYERMTIERTKNDAASSELREALSLGIPLSPSNAAQMKTLAKAFTSETAGLKMGDPAWQAKALAVADQVRVLPQQVETWLDGSARSPEQSVVIKAARFYGALDAQSREAVGSLPSTARVLLGTVADLLRTGATPETAFQTARKNIYEADEGVIKNRRAEYGKLVASNASALDSFIDADFDPGLFSAQPAATLSLQTDFERSTGTYYAKVGDIDLARKLAWQDLKRVYGPTHVNGRPEMSLYPIEAFGARPDDVRTDLAAFLKANPQPSAASADDVVVVADSITQRSMADTDTGRVLRPTYALVTKSGDVLLNADGTRARWSPPDAQSLQERMAAERERRSRESVDAARAKRELIRADQDRAVRAFTGEDRFGAAP